MKRSNLSIIVFTLTALSFFALALYSTARSESPIDTKTGPESRGDDATSQDPKRQPTPEINGVILGQGLLKVLSFYDRNANGIFDPSDSELVNWPITISPLGIVKLTPVSVDLSSSLNPYTLTEGVPLQTNWVQSTSDSITVNVVEGRVREVDFGNYCTISSGGRGLGFWSNRNGQSLLTEADFASLTDAKLVNSDGSDRDFTSSLALNKAALKSWLLNADGVNAAYMLSTQLAIMKLNILHGFVDGNAFALCYGGSVNNLSKGANTALVADQSTFANDANRSTQEVLKNCLDTLNSGGPVVPVTPCPYSFP